MTERLLVSLQLLADIVTRLFFFRCHAYNKTPPVNRKKAGGIVSNTKSPSEKKRFFLTGYFRYELSVQ